IERMAWPEPFRIEMRQGVRHDLIDRRPGDALVPGCGVQRDVAGLFDQGHRLRQIRLTFHCSTAERPPRTASRHPAIALSTPAGSDSNSPCAPLASAILAKSVEGAYAAPKSLLALASPAG